MPKEFKPGTKVEWKWLGRGIPGEVIEIYFETVSREIKGSMIKRKGSKENPAYLVKSEAGNLALKLHSELSKVEAKAKSKVKPKIFS